MRLRMTCVAGIWALEEVTGVPALTWQNPILCFSMRSSCERMTTPCRSTGTSACGVNISPQPCRTAAGQPSQVLLRVNRDTCQPCLNWFMAVIA